MSQNNLQKQLQDFIVGLKLNMNANDDQQIMIIMKMKKQARLWVSPLNVWGTAQEYHCDPKDSREGLKLCQEHFIHCGAAERFGNTWISV